MAKKLQQTYRMIKSKEGEDNKGLIKIEEPRHQPSTLFNGKSVKKTNNIEDSEDGNYDCFAISYLINDLFRGNEYVKGYNTAPIINLITIPKAGKDKLAFFLPKDIFSYIEEKRSRNSSKEDYYGHFFQLKYSDNFISNYIYDYYTEIGWDKFIEKVQTHIINKFANIDLSSNEELINYLSSVGDDTIVPKSKSSKANSAFSKLIEGAKNGNSENLALIIANFFISCFLGLRSMNCKVESYKMYLLSEYGMECIWRPDLITPPHEQINEARQMYKCGSYALSYKIGKQWLSEYETRANKEELAIAYQILGSSLYKLASSNSREYKGKQSEGIEYLEKCIETGKADLSVFYSLYEYLKNNDIEKAIGNLKTAFAQNYAKAVIEVAFLYLNDTLIFDNVPEELLLEKINYIIENEQRNDVVDVGNCLYLRGRFAKKNGNESKAQKDFEVATRKGNERAKKELIRKERNAEKGVFPSFSNQARAKCCFANTLTGTNYQIISTFPSNEWALFAPIKTSVNGIQIAHSIDEFINLQHIGKFEFCRPKILFLFMSEDKEKNLNDCLELLDKLFNAVIEISDLSDKQKWELIDNTYIYVNANYETACMLIDANISQMGENIYFKVHIADENRDTVHKLLCDAPLFLPALNGAKSESITKVVLFGSSEMNYCFVKESIASAYLGAIHPIDITLLGESADVLENRFNQECPGVFGCPNITCIRPKFIKCNIKETDFPRLISGQAQVNPAATKKPDDVIAETLKYGNYFIVDYSDDLENIRFAMELRTWLLRSRDTFDRTPFIAVRVSNRRNSYLSSHLTLSGQAAGNSYYNKYDLFPFGISAQTYHYKNIIEDPVLNRIALQIHKFYYLDNDLDKNDEKKLKEALEECKRSAENDFYSYSYNADSSILTAIGLCYRFFVAGCVLASKESYLDFGAFKDQDLLKKFIDQLETSNNKEKLAKLEQTRWNSFMLIRSWLPADINQVKAYEEQSFGSAHKHVLAKLHPFIREWDDLDDPDLDEVLGILKLRANYNKKPQDTTRRSIEDTTRFFITESKEKEITR